MDKSNFKCEQRVHLTKEQRLPKCFKDAEKVIRTVKTCKSNFKTVLANSRFRRSHFKKVYALTFNVLKQYDYIQRIINELKLLEKEKPLRTEIASILIYELIFGTGTLPGESKPIVTIQQYKRDILNMHEKLSRETHDLKGVNLPRYARVHTLVTTVPYVIKDLKSIGYVQFFYNEDSSEEEYFQLIRSLQKGTFLIDYHFKDILVFAYDENLINLDLYQKGHIFLQDKSSYIPIHVLDPKPGTAVLDACAAPGMKAVHIAAKMENKGLLIACEMNKNRFETLKEMLQYGAVKISKIFCSDFKLIDPNDQVYSSLDYILLDPSCSGSGMVNRMDEVTDTEDSKNITRLEKLSGFQIVLLKHALKFPSVKRIVYSTCSIHEEENEYVVHEALNAFSCTFKLVPVMPEWSIRGLKSYEYGELCLRTEPQKNLTNGFFVAMFERIDDTEQYEGKHSAKKYIKNKINTNKFKSTERNLGFKTKNIYNHDISLDINPVIKDDESLNSQFDSASTKERKKKSSFTSEFIAGIKKRNENDEIIDTSSSLHKRKQKSKETVKQLQPSYSYEEKHHALQKSKETSKHKVINSNLEIPDDIRKKGDIKYIYDIKPLNSHEKSVIETSIICDTKKYKKTKKHENHTVNIDIDNVDNNAEKHKKKKYKKHLEDSYVDKSQMLISCESFQDDGQEIIDRINIGDKNQYEKNESKNLSFQILNVDKSLENVSNNCKKKHKHYKISKNYISDNDQAFKFHKSTLETLETERFDLDARNGKFLLTESGDSSHVKKKKKHKKVKNIETVYGK